MSSTVDVVDELSLENSKSLAKDQHTSADVLVKLAKDSDVGVRYFVGNNCNTPVEVLIALSEDDDAGVRCGVAENPNTPVGVLLTLSKDTEGGVRRNVARNHSTPVSVLITLHTDEDKNVRYFVAGNPNTPVDVLMELVKDITLNVRVAANPSAPENLCLSIYDNLVQQDKLKEVVAILFVHKNILFLTEVLALIATYGEGVAQAAAESMVVEKNSLLEKVLTEYGCTSSKKTSGQGITL